VPLLEREEYIEQAYLYRMMAMRIAQEIPTQELLGMLKHEILATSKLYLAIDYLSADLKMHGLMSPAMQRLGHYFTPYQSFLVSEAEREKGRFDLNQALLILEREAGYRAQGTTPQGMFLYQFESLSRNRLNYDRGLTAIAHDPLFDEAWREWILLVRKQVGFLDIADLIYLRSEQQRIDQQRKQHGDSEETPAQVPLFGVKEGRIAWANRGRDPLLLFAALHRQLGYPEVPKTDFSEKQYDMLPALMRRMERLESRMKLIDEEQRGTFDLSKLYVKPEKPPKSDLDDLL
jgi:hypothetical protein